MVSEMDSAIANSANLQSVQMGQLPQAQSGPSAAQIGVEFVRQYFTMLNRAPHLLFRFYSDDSTFIHGSMDRHGAVAGPEVTRGQKQINAKIMQLNYVNCHTKIRQVDSMKTIGDGVVIQVIGELSNNGQPLRRFMQTFVLAPQSLNKYYVRNDIFRYQDDVFVEDREEKDEGIEETDGQSQTDISEEEAVIEEQQQPAEQLIAKDYYQSNGTMTNNTSAVVSSSIAEREIAAPVPVTEEHVAEARDPSLQQPVQETSSVDGNISSCMSADVSESSVKPEQPSVEKEPEAEPVPELPINTNPLLNEPKTYASMLKSFHSAPPAAPPALSKPAPVSAPVNPAVNLVNHNINDNVAVTETAPVAAAQPPLPQATSAIAPKNTNRFPIQRDQRFANNKGRGGFGGGFNNGRKSESRDGGKMNDIDSTGETDARINNNTFVGNNNKPIGGGSNGGDDRQLFIGNLLPNFKEEDLHKIFAPFGKIIDVRINRQTHKTNSNKAARNYGFITFENPEVVDQIIAQKPIFHDNHRYNVEKKQGKSAYVHRNQSTTNNGPRNGGMSPNDAERRQQRR